MIRFEKVPLVTPNGDVLIASLDLEVRSGVNVLVCGPNGERLAISRVFIAQVVANRRCFVCSVSCGRFSGVA